MMNTRRKRAYSEVTAEVDKLPAAPEVGAFFDFDGTVIAGYSAVSLMRMQIKRGELSVRQIAESARAMASFGLGNTSFSTMMIASAQFLEGIEEADYLELGEQLFDREIAKLVYPESRALIEAHQRKGHKVAIITSAMPYQVMAAADSLGIEHVMCSHMKVEEGKFTGEVEPPICFGEGKVLAAESLAEDLDLDLAKSYFYSDSDDDLELLERVGNPRPLNPNKKLSAIAARNDWPVQRFDSRGRPRMSKWLRSLLATGAILTSAASGLPIWALTGSKRESQNFSSSLFADTASALIGLSLNVSGEVNLWKRRPAVFIFNHQSKADLIIVAKLLRRDFAGVARKHAKSPQLFEKALDLSGVVLLDLDQPREAVARMRELGDTVREQGISVAIAPEGTRSRSKRLGEFKKGAFQLAMQAGIPIVPIVIHNALDVAPRGDFLYHSATVDVDVLPPVNTRGWNRTNLADNIEAVRRSFLDALGQTEE